MIMLTEILGAGTLLLTFYMAYKAKDSSVESETERQQHLTQKCEGQKIMGDPTVIRIESLKFERHDRDLCQWLSEECPGNTIVSWSYPNVFIEPSFLEQLGDKKQEYAGIKAEDLDTKIVGDTTMTSWELETNDSTQIFDFLRGQVNAVDDALERGQDYVEVTKRTKIS